MTRCERIQSDAPGIAALHPGDPEREESWAHSRECAACARALQEAERLQAILDAPGVPLSAAEARRLFPSTIVSDLKRERRRRTLASAVAIGVAFGVSVLFARHRSSSAHDWFIAVGVAAAALASAIAAASRRWAAIVIAAVSVIAIALALATGTPGAADAAVGVHCLATELACAAVVVGATWLAIRGGTSSLGPRATAAAAAVGALAGVAALELTCPARTSLFHLLSFHVAGVLFASASAAAMCRLVPDRRAFT